MKVLFIRSNPVNPDSRVEKEVDTLLGGGHEVEILAWDRSANYKIKTEEITLKTSSTVIHRIGIKAEYGGGIKKNLLPLLKFQFEIAKYLLTNHDKFDVIHACDFDTAYISSKVAKIIKVKFVYDIFDYYVDAFSVPKKLKKIIQRTDNKIINNADAVIICTEKRIKQIASTKPKKITVIHNAPPNIENEIEIEVSDKTKICYIGILQEDRLIKELIEVVVNDGQFELHIGGFGKLENEINELSIRNENIKFYGRVPYEKTLEVENKCHVITAIYDPKIKNHIYAAPNKFYEALMLGRPLIMAKGTGMSEVVAKEKIGVLIDYNKEDLKRGLDELVRDRNQWSVMSQKMKKIYKEEYSWEEMSNRLVNLYNNL